MFGVGGGCDAVKVSCVWSSLRRNVVPGMFVGLSVSLSVIVYNNMNISLFLSVFSGLNIRLSVCQSVSMVYKKNLKM